MLLLLVSLLMLVGRSGFRRAHPFPTLVMTRPMVLLLHDKTGVVKAETAWLVLVMTVLCAHVRFYFESFYHNYTRTCV